MISEANVKTNMNMYEEAWYFDISTNAHMMNRKQWIG
jgi:hypothetical protein